MTVHLEHTDKLFACVFIVQICQIGHSVFRYFILLSLGEIKNMYGKGQNIG